jgi:hypothetical protein
VRQLAARSVSRPVWERHFHDDAGSTVGQVLVAFERACYLQLTDGSLIALVIPEVGDGPLSLTIDGDADQFTALKPGTPIVIAGKRLRVDDVEVTLDGVRVWEPCPEWETLRAHRAHISERLHLVLTLALSCAPEGSLLGLLTESTVPQTDRSVLGIFLARARQAAQLLRAGWADGGAVDRRMRAGSEDDLASLRSGAAQLAGLGGGLTPAGDDFLTGAMLWAWLAHPAPAGYCATLLSASITGTTILSAALLQAASRGECSAPWHDMLGALAGGSDAELERAVQGVLAHGHTSGADALAGFLWMQNG